MKLFFVAILSLAFSALAAHSEAWRRDGQTLVVDPFALDGLDYAILARIVGVPSERVHSHVRNRQYQLPENLDEFDLKDDFENFGKYIEERASSLLASGPINEVVFRVDDFPIFSAGYDFHDKTFTLVGILDFRVHSEPMHYSAAAPRRFYHYAQAGSINVKHIVQTRLGCNLNGGGFSLVSKFLAGRSYEQNTPVRACYHFKMEEDEARRLRDLDKREQLLLSMSCKLTGISPTNSGNLGDMVCHVTDFDIHSRSQKAIIKLSHRVASVSIAPGTLVPVEENPAPLTSATLKPPNLSAIMNELKKEFSGGGNDSGAGTESGGNSDAVSAVPSSNIVSAEPSAEILSTAPSPEPRSEYRTADVRDMQARLLVSGFDPKGIDGVAGPGFEHAIALWQSNQGLPVTGYMTDPQYYLLRQKTDRVLFAWLERSRKNWSIYNAGSSNSAFDRWAVSQQQQEKDHKACGGDISADGKATIQAKKRKPYWACLLDLGYGPYPPYSGSGLSGKPPLP